MGGYENVETEIKKLNEEIKKTSEEFAKLRKEMRGLGGRTSGRHSKLNYGDLVGAVKNFMPKQKFQANENYGGFSGKDLNFVSSLTKSITSKVLGYRATGGNVASGGAYVVGENGPEIFTPNGSGQIQNSAGESNINVNMKIESPDAESFAQSKGQIVAEMVSALQNSRLL